MAARERLLIFTIWTYSENLKKSSPLPNRTGPISKKNYRDHYWLVYFTKLVQEKKNRSENMAASGRGLFLLYEHIVIFKNLLL